MSQKVDFVAYQLLNKKNLSLPALKLQKCYATSYRKRPTFSGTLRLELSVPQSAINILKIRKLKSVRGGSIDNRCWGNRCWGNHCWDNHCWGNRCSSWGGVNWWLLLRWSLLMRSLFILGGSIDDRCWWQLLLRRSLLRQSLLRQLLLRQSLLRQSLLRWSLLRRLLLRQSLLRQLLLRQSLFILGGDRSDCCWEDQHRTALWV